MHWSIHFWKPALTFSFLCLIHTLAHTRVCENCRECLGRFKNWFISDVLQNTGRYSSPVIFSPLSHSSAGKFKTMRTLMSQSISLRTQLCFSEFKMERNYLEIKKGETYMGQKYACKQYYRLSKNKLFIMYGFDTAWSKAIYQFKSILIITDCTDKEYVLTRNMLRRLQKWMEGQQSLESTFIKFYRQWTCLY